VVAGFVLRGCCGGFVSEKLGSWKSGFDNEGTGDPCNGTVALRPVHQHLFIWRFVVRNGFERGMRYDTAVLLALPIPVAYIDEASRRAGCRIA
jgi:hypothetical protein